MFKNVDFPTKETQKFADYWQSLPRQALIPSRKSFDPIAVAALLPGVAMYEMVSDKEILIRLAGTAVVNIYGQEITGKNYLDFWAPGYHASMVRAHELMLNHPCGLIVALEGQSASGQVSSSVSVGFPILNVNDSPMMLFCSSRMKMLHNRDNYENPLVRLKVIQTTPIDIGAGLPTPESWIP